MTFITFVVANRKIVTFGGYFEAFIAKLPKRVVQKIDYGLVLLKTMDRLPAKHMKYLEEGLFELRTEFEGNIYRTFFIFDGNQLVVLFNGFHKKGQKTPKTEIEKAKRIKKEYDRRTNQ
ncbi:MAG: type II toxin-antitoxin system RelE/ParE family toxin [Bacteroidales bacterium]|nr:type II toxin-antitoxin system RelE/ParE family toxin [Bacteroidales bacterium]